MRPSSTARWRRQAGILLLGFVSLGGIGLSGPGRHFFSSAQSFLAYYQALERSGVNSSFFERVMCSLVLASAEAAAPRQEPPRATSSS